MSPTLLWVLLSALGADSAGTMAHPDQGAVSWANVAPEDEAAATVYRDHGNKALDAGLAEEAAGYYRQALERWDHPAIHYNYAQALLEFSKPLECHDHLEAAIRYGAEPLGGENRYKEAMTLLATVENDLVRIELTCDEPGAHVSVDDHKDLLECPRRFVHWMLPGTHVLSIEKPGLVSRKKTVDLPKGERVSLNFQIFTADQMKRFKARWAWWIPWTALGIGAAAGATAAAVHVHSYNLLQSYDTSIAGCAAAPVFPAFSGCPLQQSQEFAPLRSRAYTEQGVAWGLDLVGGAAFLAGAILLRGNLSETYLDDPDLTLRTVTVAPAVGPGLTGVRLSIAF